MSLTFPKFINHMTILGLGISGCETDESQNTLRESVLTMLNTTHCQVRVCSDSIATVLTAFPPKEGGTILIAGTGSNCIFLLPIVGQPCVARVISCGGWGADLADYGSGYWIAMEAVKHMIDYEDFFKRSHCSIDCLSLPVAKVKAIVLKKFGLKSLVDIFDAFGSQKLPKSQIAQIALEIANLADSDDALAKHIFHEAGRHLANMVLGIIRSTSKRFGKPFVIQCLAKNEQRMDVACSGSVFKSWHLLRPGFLSIMNSSNENSLREQFPEITCIRLRRLCCSAAVGAAVFANLPSTKFTVEWQLNSVVFENIFP